MRTICTRHRQTFPSIDGTNESTAIWGLWYRTLGWHRRTQRSTTCPSVSGRRVGHHHFTSYIFVPRHPAAPHPIRLQAARTLDDILVIIPRHLSAAPSDLQAAVQRRVLDVRCSCTADYAQWRRLEH